MASGGRSGFKGLKVLIAEDELLPAMELESELTEMGAIPLGPAGRVGDILPLADRAPPDIAVLDINMAGEQSYPAAVELHRRGIPVLFVTGYDDLVGCPSAMAEMPHLTKPISSARLRHAIAWLMKIEE